MSIFDDIPRDDLGPPLQDETQFAYLNRSGRAEAARVREKVDAWFAAYPESHRDALVARFRSAIDDQHRSAFFELFLYHMLLARGLKVLEIEPKLEHTDKSPDFLVENAKGDRFYVEAVQASGLSAQQVAAQARLNTALSAIDSTPSPLHFLDLRVTGSPTAPLSTKKLKTALKSWIAGLPADETARQASPFVWEEHGAKIQLNAWTRNKPDKKGRAIGVRRSPVMRIDPSQEIRPGLRKKASRYGKLDHPYLVAINALSTHHSELAVIDALLGTPYVQLSKGPNGEEIVEHRRRPDGVWYGPPDGQPQNTRLSGVLALMKIDPWNFASKTGLLIPNPWTQKPLPQLGLGTDELVIVDEEYERKKGQPMHELVGLPAIWPEE
ncbi:MULTISPECIES: hypothetical protein [unclassified Bradyrhizobium]|uniref:hypothetical protein n=1 Tax=unclassified Bradyrhizobium TaxID=2631580 RepID=UPI001CD42496|nr:MULTISPECIES: hypothetical protein [unclassified Bradyrhizobium]MCA1373567.1 hypothetical protein [Bradyrhizobium sp. IC4060]MCA1487210.1 hypothetical protein [Bradyrhizobium sp. IC4061]